MLLHCRQLCSSGVSLLHAVQRSKFLSLVQPALRKRLTSTSASSNITGVLTSDSDIDATLTAAAEAAGVPPGTALKLSENLKRNWYTTAGDVAAMSKEELQQMQFPVKLWAIIKALIEAGSKTSINITTSNSSSSSSINAMGNAVLAGEQLTQTLSHFNPAATAQPLPADIMARRMPANIVGTGVARRKAGSTQSTALLADKQAYIFRDDEMTELVNQDFAQLQHFCCGTFPGQRVAPLRPASFTSYKQQLRLMLGYVHRVRAVPLDELRLQTLIPSCSRDAVSLLMEYQHWRRTVRGCAPRTQLMPIKAAIALCRFLYHDQSEPTAKPPYRDLPVVQELATMLKAAHSEAATAPLVTDESRKWLSWNEYLGLVRALHAECAGLTASGKPRYRAEVANSLQRYLIAAILSVIPDRQRTLRELEVGRTLFKREDGSWVIKHTAADYKTGKKYGDRPPLVIAPFIYPELEAYISTWREELNPNTSKLFVQPVTGREHTPNSLHRLFSSAALRLTGKATNPHLVRDMIVTHLRDQGATEQDMESLAMVMAHSVEEQRKTYDRRTKDQKVQPAVSLMLELSKRL